MIISVATGGAPPAEQIRDQIAGLVTTGQLAAGERLPSVRQLAGDLGIAPGTVAKAYKALEADGFLITRIGAGTRVNPDAVSIPDAVVHAARALGAAGRAANLDLDEVVRILRATW